MRAGVAAALAAAALACGSAHAQPASPTIDERIAALAEGLDPRAAAVLPAIHGTGRRLLAARAYLRNAGRIGERWSWTAAQAAEFAGSAEGRALESAIARVACAFAAANPGYALWVNPEFRSLELQLERWNANYRVGRAGDDLLAQVTRGLAEAERRNPAAPAGAADLRRLLEDARPDPVPTLAAPGLSLHGRMRAVDFQVTADGAIVAGTDSASIRAAWIASGWKERLRAAVAAADAGFHGPLAVPDEPWHYEFRPEARHGGDDFTGDCDPAA